MGNSVHAAYWEVVSVLTPYQDIHSALTRVEAGFCVAVETNPRWAGKLLADSLAGFEWDWPAWHDYAQGEDFDAVPVIAEQCEPGSKARAPRLKKCREQMAVQIAARVSRIVYAKERYLQLTNVDLLRMRPCWRFRIAGASLGCENTPSRCGQLDGVVLPAKDAIRTFPRLPCDYLGCRCSIEAVKDPNG